MKQGKFIIGILVILIIVGIGFWAGNKPGKYAPLTQCLKEKGVKMFGAFWCPHCQKQKAMFGVDAKTLPYVECSNPDGKTQTQICIDNKIESYPTWEFPDGTRVLGEKSPAILAEKANCTASLPAEEQSKPVDVTPVQ